MENKVCHCIDSKNQYIRHSGLAELINIISCMPCEDSEAMGWCHETERSHCHTIDSSGHLVSWLSSALRARYIFLLVYVTFALLILSTKSFLHRGPEGFDIHLSRKSVPGSMQKFALLETDLNFSLSGLTVLARMLAMCM